MTWDFLSIAHFFTILWSWKVVCTSWRDSGWPLICQICRGNKIVRNLRTSLKLPMHSQSWVAAGWSVSGNPILIEDNLLVFISLFSSKDDDADYFLSLVYKGQKETWLLSWSIEHDQAIFYFRHTNFQNLKINVIQVIPVRGRAWLQYYIERGGSLSGPPKVITYFMHGP